MGFFLVKSPLAIAVGAALVAVGEVVELDDDEGARLVANGTVEVAEVPAASEEGGVDEPVTPAEKKAKKA